MSTGPAPRPPGPVAAEPFRCATAARDRGDDLAASAPPAVRLLLVEVPGPWGRAALTESRLDHYVAGRLGETAAHAGVRVLLVRRPGRTAASPPAAPRSWALADLRPGHEAVAWGTWTDPRALLEVDLREAVVPSGPQRVALCCTHARHDVCCALRGRPVAAALAEAFPAGAGADDPDAPDDWHVWECSHLGGDRFAANVLLLPTGDLFGALDPAGAVDVVRRFAAGRTSLAHWRGRYGRSPVAQAALHRTALALEEDRRDALDVVGVEERPGERWTVEVAHVDTAGFEQRYVVHLSAQVSRPHLLTCAAVTPSRARTFTAEGPPAPVLRG
ncbi:sucrase ferredoxin [Kineosporia sp. R_H_3]|uniref:sucrase ferredoxin n=1 Tax=Kineosporia sp. R_H_3 TaxID=1961848 RepID=UPI000B4C0ED8|nr:sucrase ferredoxin [Kineosporia sp. R_H_3]